MQMGWYQGRIERIDLGSPRDRVGTTPEMGEIGRDPIRRNPPIGVCRHDKAIRANQFRRARHCLRSSKPGMRLIRG